jgi:NAD(P)-dependent dehydrogenase (short-subunit alcohol dehydrogenase family)
MTLHTAPSPLLSLAPAPGSQVAVVGGCGGIGRAVVAALAVSGAEIAVLDLAASLDAHPMPGGVVGVEIDARDAGSVAAAFAAIEAGWGGLDVLVNLCGYRGTLAPVDALDAAAWDDAIAGNLRSAYLIAHHGIPLMKAAGRGSIVMVSSGLGVYGGAHYGAYAAAKGAVNALVKTLAKENAPTIRANAVAPSYVETAFGHGGTGRSAENEPGAIDLASYARAIPLGRVAEAADVVGPILFLAGPASGYMTGQVLHVNGGAFMP